MKEFILIPTVKVHDKKYEGKQISAEILQKIVDLAVWTFERNFENAYRWGVDCICDMHYAWYEGKVYLKTREEVSYGQIDKLCEVIYVEYPEINCVIELKLSDE